VRMMVVKDPFSIVSFDHGEQSDSLESVVCTAIVEGPDDDTNSRPVQRPEVSVCDSMRAF
jgi:hypothetical protein